MLPSRTSLAAGLDAKSALMPTKTISFPSCINPECSSWMFIKNKNRKKKKKKRNNCHIALPTYAVCRRTTEGRRQRRRRRVRRPGRPECTCCSKHYSWRSDTWRGPRRTGQRSTDCCTGPPMDRPLTTSPEERTEHQGSECTSDPGTLWSSWRARTQQCRGFWGQPFLK